MNYDILDFEKTVPRRLLDFYVEKLEIEVDKRSSYEGVYNALTEEKPALMKKIYQQHCYAGSTAVNIFEESTLPKMYLTKERFIKILKNELGRDEVFSCELRPPLDEKPQINYVEDRGDSILIQFVVKGKNRRIRNGYDIVEIPTVEFEFAIVHFGEEVLIELRCAYSKRIKYLTCFEDYFRHDLGDNKRKFNWNPITKVNNAEAEKIAEKLSAGLVLAEHKDDGIFDRHLVSASPKVKDLREKEEYTKMFKNKILLSQNLTIDFETTTEYGTYESEVKFKMNLNTGFQFLNKVDEAIIDYVMKAFIDVRYGEEKKNLSDVKGTSESILIENITDVENMMQRGII